MQEPAAEIAAAAAMTTAEPIAVAVARQGSQFMSVLVS